MEFYTESQKQLQATFDSRRLAERVEASAGRHGDERAT